MIRRAVLCVLSLLAFSTGAVADQIDAARLDKLFVEKDMAMNFNVDRWKAKPHPPAQFPCNERTFMLPDLVRKYSLIGMPLPEVSKVLGEPCSVGESKSSISYELNFPTCGGVARLFLQLELKENLVWRYRLEEIDTNTPGTTTISHSNWVTSNFTKR